MPVPALRRLLVCSGFYAVGVGARRMRSLLDFPGGIVAPLVCFEHGTEAWNGGGHCSEHLVTGVCRD